MNRSGHIPGHPYYGAETWLDRIFTLLLNKEFSTNVDPGMIADPMRMLLDEHGPMRVPMLQLLADDELAKVGPGGKPSRTPPPPSLADFFRTPILKPPHY